MSSGTRKTMENGRYQPRKAITKTAGVILRRSP